MNSKSIDLKNQINAKREELYHHIGGGIMENILEKSRELDVLIVEFLKEDEEN